MPEREQVHYFGAGPAPLPTTVLEEAGRSLLNYEDSGVGLAEMSHRSASASAIVAEAQESLRKLLDVPASEGPDGYTILFAQGGGSGGFSSVVANMVAVWVGARLKELAGDEQRLRAEVAEKLRLDYLVTGSWSLKASQEAARLAGPEHVRVRVDARSHREGRKFGVIPADVDADADADKASPALTYYCDNETVDGVEFRHAPSGYNLVADMSSNLLSRAVDVRRHAVLFGGAQKNVGSAGVTIFIVSNAVLPPHADYASPQLLRSLGLPVCPVVFDWPTLAKNNSLYNTLPIFDVWICARVMRGLLLKSPPENTPGILGQQAESEHKAALLYAALDRHSSVYGVVPDASARSRMNLCFRVGGGVDATEKAFLKGAEARGLLGLKGHRSVGGIRISNYNAVPVAAAEKLAAYLDDYAAGEQGARS